MSWNPFAHPPLRTQLEMQRASNKEARVVATAQAAYWRNQEEFLRKEGFRLTAEIASLDDAASLPTLAVDESLVVHHFDPALMNTR